jgi:hypothetical protein
MYNLPIDELKSRYTDVCIGAAIRKWKSTPISTVEFGDKISKLFTHLERASKGEFIATYNYYVKSRKEVK